MITTSEIKDEIKKYKEKCENPEYVKEKKNSE